MLDHFQGLMDAPRPQSYASLSVYHSKTFHAFYSPPSAPGRRTGEASFQLVIDTEKSYRRHQQSAEDGIIILAQPHLRHSLTQRSSLFLSRIDNETMKIYNYCPMKGPYSSIVRKGNGQARLFRSTKHHFQACKINDMID